MAIVATMTASNGVRVYIDDACAAKKGTPEYERVKAEINRVAHDILVRNWMREHPEEAQLIRERKKGYIEVTETSTT